MPTIKRILCPVDFSDTAALAAREAAQLARAAGAELLLLHALDEPLLGGGGRPGFQAPIAQQYEMILRQKLDVAASGLRLLSPVRALIVYGAVDEAIATAASQHGADVIVMGARSRKGIARILGDSMTERVMRKARVPVVRVSPSPARKPPMRHSMPHGVA
ncbi:MAG TPA: universal stress protein [Polyangiales bacterium]|nr:universal stress protein [Polyangiales bacterium]